MKRVIHMRKVAILGRSGCAGTLWSVSCHMRKVAILGRSGCAGTLWSELVNGHTWWAWADIDIIFGDLMRYMGEVPQVTNLINLR